MVGAAKGVPLPSVDQLSTLSGPATPCPGAQAGRSECPAGSPRAQARGGIGGRPGSGPRPGRRAVVRLVGGCESRAADAAEGAVCVHAARVDAERNRSLGLIALIDIWGGGWRSAATQGWEPGSLTPCPLRLLRQKDVEAEPPG